MRVTFFPRPPNRPRPRAGHGAQERPATHRRIPVARSVVCAAEVATVARIEWTKSEEEAVVSARTTGLAILIDFFKPT